MAKTGKLEEISINKEDERQIKKHTKYQNQTILSGTKICNENIFARAEIFLEFQQKF